MTDNNYLPDTEDIQPNLAPDARAQMAWEMLEAGIYDDPSIRAALRADVQTGEANGMVFADTPMSDAPQPDAPTGLYDNTPAIIVMADAPNPYILSYSVEIEREESNPRSTYYTVSLLKEVHGASPHADSRAIGTYEVYEGGDNLAASTAQGLYQLKDDVETLTGNPVEGAQAMVSMARQIALDNGMIEENEPFFADERLPADPFQIEPPEQLLQRYQTLEMDTSSVEIEF